MPDLVSQLQGSAASTEGSATGAAAGTEPNGEDRIKGFQQALSRKDQELEELRTRLEEQRLAAMSEDERDTFHKQREANEVRLLREENARLKVIREIPDVADDLDRLFGAKTLKEQAEIIRALKKGTSGAPVVPDVDPNNPQRRPIDTRLVDGMEMNDQLAEQIIRGYGR